MLEIEGRLNRIAGSHRWSRAGAHLIVVTLVAMSAATGVISARAHELTAETGTTEAAAFPFNLVALAQAAEDSSASLSPLILNLDPATFEAPVSRDGSRDPSLFDAAYAHEPLDVATAEELADAAAAANDGPGPEPEVVAPETPAVEPPPVVVAAPAPEVAVPAQPATALLGWPVSGGTISQGFWPGHLGLDIAAPWGAPVTAAASGTVTYAGWRDNGGGYVVEIAHENGLVTSYNHMSSVWVWPGQYVTWGQGVGAVGCTGLCYGPHLHFAVFQGYTAVNPLRYL